MTGEFDNDLNIDAVASQQARQIQYYGEENQLRLYRSKVLLIGSGTVGQLTAGCMAGLGIGNMVVMDNKRSALSDIGFMMPRLRYRGLKKAPSIEKIVRSINDNTKVRGVHSEFSESMLDFLNFTPEMIVDTQNDPLRKEHALEYAVRKGIPFISTYCGNEASSVCVAEKNNEHFDDILSVPDFAHGVCIRRSVAAGMAAGVATDEVKKQVFRMDESDKSLETMFYYNLASDKRKGTDSECRMPERFEFREPVLVAGAGAIGNFVAMHLALSGFKVIDILDSDVIEHTNLSRQLLFYDSVGSDKAEKLASRIRGFSSAESRGISERLSEDSQRLFRERGYGLLFGCFDNQEARYNLNFFAISNGIKYLDGGTSPNMGNLATYDPGRTSCVACKKGLSKVKTRASCADQPLPSVVITNAIIGSLMVGEAMHAVTGSMLDKGFVYDTYDKRRLYLTEEGAPRSDCPCNNSGGESFGA